MIAWLALNIVWASAAMLLVLALRQPAARLFGAGVTYALWLVPALRLIQPPLPVWHGAIPSVASPETLVVFVEEMTSQSSGNMKYARIAIMAIRRMWLRRACCGRPSAPSVPIRVRTAALIRDARSR